MFEELLAEATAEMAGQRHEIVDAFTVRAHLALLEQGKLAAATARLDAVHTDGLGERVATIHVDLYHLLALKYGYETLRDPDFMRCLLRDNPELRVKSRARVTTLRVDGFRPPRSADARTGGIITA